MNEFILNLKTIDKNIDKYVSQSPFVVSELCKNIDRAEKLKKIDEYYSNYLYIYADIYNLNNCLYPSSISNLLIDFLYTLVLNSSNLDVSSVKIPINLSEDPLVWGYTSILIYKLSYYNLHGLYKENIKLNKEYDYLNIKYLYEYYAYIGYKMGSLTCLCLYTYYYPIENDPGLIHKSDKTIELERKIYDEFLNNNELAMFFLIKYYNFCLYFDYENKKQFYKHYYEKLITVMLKFLDVYKKYKGPTLNFLCNDYLTKFYNSYKYINPHLINLKIELNHMFFYKNIKNDDLLYTFFNNRKISSSTDENNSNNECFICYEKHPLIYNDCNIESHGICMMCYSKTSFCPLCRVDISKVKKKISKYINVKYKKINHYSSDDEEEDDDEEEENDEDQEYVNNQLNAIVNAINDENIIINDNEDKLSLRMIIKNIVIVINFKEYINVINDFIKLVSKPGNSNVKYKLLNTAFFSLLLGVFTCVFLKISFIYTIKTYYYVTCLIVS